MVLNCDQLLYTGKIGKCGRNCGCDVVAETFETDLLLPETGKHGNYALIIHNSIRFICHKIRKYQLLT